MPWGTFIVDLGELAMFVVLALIVLGILVNLTYSAWERFVITLHILRNDEPSGSPSDFHFKGETF